MTTLIHYLNTTLNIAMKDACLIRRIGGSKEGYYDVVNDLDRPGDIQQLGKDDVLKAVHWCRENFKQTKTFDNDQRRSLFPL